MVGGGTIGNVTFTLSVLSQPKGATTALLGDCSQRFASSQAPLRSAWSTFVLFSTHPFRACQQVDGQMLLSQLVLLAALVLLILSGAPLVSPTWGVQPLRDMSHPEGVVRPRWG